jgi:hypothetical protein
MENFVGIRLTIDPETKTWFAENPEYNASALARKFFQLFTQEPAPMLKLLEIAQEDGIRRILIDIKQAKGDYLTGPNEIAEIDGVTKDGFSVKKVRL